MKFCSRCFRCIKNSKSPKFIVYKCKCDHIEPTEPEDLLILSETTANTETTEMYNNLIELAPFDRTNQLVKKDCPDCGLDYLTQLRIGPSEIIIYRCKCGYREIK
jgi:DNA-directed RNA polymerase subunit M/transcription elongation factor TFIIS